LNTSEYETAPQSLPLPLAVSDKLNENQLEEINMSANYIARFVRITILFATVSASLPACQALEGTSKNGGKTCQCKYFGLSGTDVASEVLYSSEPGRTGYQTRLAGHMTFDEWPLSLEGVSGFVFVDELSTYSDTPRRIIKAPFAFTVANPDYADGDDQVLDCGTTDAYASENAEPCTCSMSFNLNSIAATPASDTAATVTIAVAAEFTGPVPFAVDLVYPDPRSKYSLGFLVDVDGNGKLSPGDYQTEKQVEFNHLSGESNLMMKVELYEPAAEPSPSPSPTASPTMSPTPSAAL
jgi:hypothetical protein